MEAAGVQRWERSLEVHPHPIIPEAILAFSPRLLSEVAPLVWAETLARSFPSVI